jgi:hypothetical protein
VTPLGGSGGEVPVVGGRLFWETEGSTSEPLLLRAYDAAGGSTPLWSSSTPVNGNVPAIADGIVYTITNVGNTLQLVAFDAAGVDNCTGSPKVCAPLFSANVGGAVADGTPVEVVVAGDVVYVAAPARLSAVDANCGGPTCQPLFSSGLIEPDGHPIVFTDYLYVTIDDSSDILLAFSPN